MAEGVINAIESLSLLIGHRPTKAEQEAATRGLLAAAKKSPAVAVMVAGGGSLGDFADIGVGLGGLFARIGADAGVLPRDPVYAVTDAAYAVVGVEAEESSAGIGDLFGSLFGGGSADDQAYHQEAGAPPDTADLRSERIADIADALGDMGRVIDLRSEGIGDELESR